MKIKKSINKVRAGKKNIITDKWLVLSAQSIATRLDNFSHTVYLIAFPLVFLIFTALYTVVTIAVWWIDHPLPFAITLFIFIRQFVA